MPAPKRHKLTSGIADIVEAEAPPPAALTTAYTDNVTSDLSDSVIRGKSEAANRLLPENVVTGKRPALRQTRHHVSLYVSRKVDRAMKQIALDTGRRPHEVYLDAIRRELRDHGKDLDALMQDD